MSSIQHRAYHQSELIRGCFHDCTVGWCTCLNHDHLPSPLQCHPQRTPNPIPAVADNFSTPITTVRLCQADKLRMRSLKTPPPNMSSFIQPFTSPTIFQAVNRRLGTQKRKKHDPALSGPQSVGEGRCSLPCLLPPSYSLTSSLPSFFPFRYFY